SMRWHGTTSPRIMGFRSRISLTEHGRLYRVRRLHAEARECIDSAGGSSRKTFTKFDCQEMLQATPMNECPLSGKV
ncbi:hypothetical protein V5F77_19485, partial [Xanthobacter sp. DSM 24535]|uniref:hypothetical protein n=1 Tax=Roseixanthobacter psychrophilus TaxID=3119917 RepID=UPI003728F367